MAVECVGPVAESEVELVVGESVDGQHPFEANDFIGFVVALLSFAFVNKPLRAFGEVGEFHLVAGHLVLSDSPVDALVELDDV